MKTSLLIFNDIKIQFSYGQKVRVTKDGQHLETVNNLKAFRLFAKECLNEVQIKLAKANLKAVR
jgi:hypothetical protein